MADELYFSTITININELLSRVFDRNGRNGDFLKAIEYVSFDAKTAASQFRKKAAQNAITAEDTPILRLGTIQLYKKCDFKSDLRFFINLFLEQGNNLPKILAKAGTLFGAVIRRKCSAYGIEFRRHRLTKGLGMKDLTLSRIARAFPVDTATEILRRKSPGILTSKLFKQELPLVMQYAIFPGLIPVTQFNEDLKGIAQILNMEISHILGSPEKKKKIKTTTVGELIESSAKYVDDAIHSEVYDDAAKVKILAEAGVLSAKDNGDFELSATTIELMNELPAIRAVYSLTYSDAVIRLESK